MKSRRSFIKTLGTGVVQPTDLIHFTIENGEMIIQQMIVTGKRSLFQG